MSVKELVNTKKYWDALVKQLDEEIAVELKSLSAMSDTVGIFRSQGKIQAFTNLKSLRDKINRNDK